jgi:multidrug resistance efflux pump
MEELMKTEKIIVVFLGLVLTVVLLTGCDAIAPAESEGISASGVVEAVEVSIAPEVSGKVIEVLVREGDSVQKGDSLVVLENELLGGQQDQAVAAVETAEAALASADAAISAAEVNLEVANLNLELAELQHEMVLQGRRLADLPGRQTSWNGEVPTEFDLPSWYFLKEEDISALEKEVEDARNNLVIERENLKDVLADVSNADIQAVEERLAFAQTSFELAEELRDRAVEQEGREAINNYLDSLYDSAEAELESAQAEYDSLLSDVGADDLLEARARVVVANERYQLALASLYQQYTGEDSLQVVQAELGVEQASLIVKQAEVALRQAHTGLIQAEKGVAQAYANLDLIELQIGKLTLSAGVDGVVLVKTIDVGELIQPGMTALTIGQLDDLMITVYVPEEKYGTIQLGDSAQVKVDSFEGQVFTATVTRIADRAEYTPRNVQTEEDRRTTVFAIELTVEDTDGKLKPGMPADVDFSP